MSVVVSLRSVVGELEIVHDEFTVFLNTRTGELVGLSMDELRAAEREDDPGFYPEWQQESILKAQQVLESDDYITLPSRFDIHEWEIMRQFCFSLEREDVREELLDAIHGTGAFRWFRSLTSRYDLEQAWYRFRERSLANIAIEWLEEKGLAYSDDMETREISP